jgi:hypothetical protein
MLVEDSLMKYLPIKEFLSKMPIKILKKNLKIEEECLMKDKLSTLILIAGDLILHFFIDPMLLGLSELLKSNLN